MGQRYRIKLAAEERRSLEQLLAKGKADVRRLKHAQILLNSDESNGNRAWRVPRIAEAIGCGTATVERVRRRFISPLQLLEETELEEGLKRMERELPERNVYTLEWLAAIAIKT